jgi:hypothetical protein
LNTEKATHRNSLINIPGRIFKKKLRKYNQEKQNSCINIRFQLRIATFPLSLWLPSILPRVKPNVLLPLVEAFFVQDARETFADPSPFSCYGVRHMIGIRHARRRFLEIAGW